MADVLDQNEVDALLAAVDAGEVKEERKDAPVFARGRRGAAESAEVKPYDFKRPERVSKDQMRALQTLHEGFARNFGASLSGFLRTIVEVKVATCEQMTYSEFTSGLPNPTSFNLVTAEGLEGQMCLEISPLIIYPIIDRLLGGTTQDLFIPQRPMTLIETRLISNVTKRGLVALAEAWAGIKQLTFTVSATESNPQLVQIVPPNEVVVVIGFELKMSNRAGTMNLCIPYNVIEPVMEVLSSQSWFAAAKNQKSKEIETQISRTLSRAPLNVTGLLAETTITLRELLELTVGDIIVTEKPAATPVTVCVEGERKFVAQIGQFRGNRALKVLRATTSEER
ncbi:MAG TPA: flagellar motor switch protein FliM [Phycisphaerales bacterium]|nr:flagellar motor switch protein FliM [Phycisphaerales bacterium]